MKRLVVGLLAVAVLASAAVAAPIARGASLRPAYDGDKLLTILVVGSDIGPPTRPGNPLKGRADALHLIAVDTRRARATIVDFPRDSMIAGDKVNAHLVRGGPDGLRRRIADYSGIKIDHHAVTSFAGLRRMASAFGGVTMTLDRGIRDRYSKSNFRAGRQRLSGPEALAFSRARKTLPNGDFDRTRHQGMLLRAAHAKLRDRPPSLAQLTRLVGAFASNTETDIPTRDLFRLASLAARIKPRNIRQVSLRGSIGSSGGASVVFLHNTDVFGDIRRGKVGR